MTPLPAPRPITEEYIAMLLAYFKNKTYPKQLKIAPGLTIRNTAIYIEVNIGLLEDYKIIPKRLLANAVDDLTDLMNYCNKHNL